MKKLSAKDLRGIVNKGLDLTLKEMEALTPEALKELLEATRELTTRNIKATDKEEYTMFLETLEATTPEAPEVEIKKVANKKAPATPAPKKEATPAPEAPEAPTPAPAPEAKQETKEAPKKPTKGKLKGNKGTPEEKLTDKIKEGNTVKFQVEDEEIQHEIKIVNIGKYNIIAVMADDEKEVFNIRKSDFNKQVFGWTDRHNETYNIIITL